MGLGEGGGRRVRVWVGGREGGVGRIIKFVYMKFMKFVHLK